MEFITEKILDEKEIFALPNTVKFWYKSRCTICGNIFQTRCKNKTTTCSRCKNSIKSKEMWKNDPNLAKKLLEKRTQTNLKKYGVENSFQRKDIVEKIKQVKKEKYGDENYNNRDKCKKTCLEKYGVEWSFQSESNKQKSRETKIKKYGSIENAYALASKKMQATKFKKYGNNVFVNPEKAKKTCLEKYGTEYAMQNNSIQKKMKKKYHYDDKEFDSSWEVAFWIYCKDLKRSIIRSPCSLQYQCDNQSFIYIPDFEVDGKLYEIKGLQFFENKDITKNMINPFDRSQDKKYEAKHQCMLQNNVHIITDCTKYLQYAANKYGENFLNSLSTK